MQNKNSKILLMLGLITSILFFNGCTKNDNTVDNDRIDGSGKLVSESRPIGTFTGIQVTNFASVFITQDTVTSLRIESDDNILDRVSTTLNGNTLVVGLRDGSYGSITVRVYVSMANVRLLESTGAAQFTSSNPIRTDSLTCRITGTGNISLTGTVNYENLLIIGSGDIHNANLISSFCSVTISGTGNVEASASRQLDATISGIGNITYFGNPSVVHQVVSGIGVIRAGG